MQLSGKKMIDCSVGGMHSAVISENGELYTWGQGSTGCLGHLAYTDEVGPHMLQSSCFLSMAFTPPSTFCDRLYVTL